MAFIKKLMDYAGSEFYYIAYLQYNEETEIKHFWMAYTISTILVKPAKYVVCYKYIYLDV